MNIENTAKYLDMAASTVTDAVSTNVLIRYYAQGSVFFARLRAKEMCENTLKSAMQKIEGVKGFNKNVLLQNGAGLSKEYII